MSYFAEFNYDYYGSRPKTSIAVFFVELVATAPGRLCVLIKKKVKELPNLGNSLWCVFWKGYQEDFIEIIIIFVYFIANHDSV